jgi:L-threonylcarbamoyladenylate synthase
LLGEPVKTQGDETGPSASLPTASPRSPGTKYRHYAPKAEMKLVLGPAEKVSGYIISQLSASKMSSGLSAGVLCTNQTAPVYINSFSQNNHIITMGSRDDLSAIAQNLFACLRHFDAAGVHIIYAEGVPETGLGRAIMNRLMKASGGNVVYT